MLVKKKKKANRSILPNTKHHSALQNMYKRAYNKLIPGWLVSLQDFQKIFTLRSLVFQMLHPITLEVFVFLSILFLSSTRVVSIFPYNC